MASTPTTYKKGSQDIRAQQETFGLFWGLTKWSLIIIGLTMILLAYFFT
jgi:hypothetical protein